MAKTTGRPQALRTAATRLTVIETVLETGSVREAGRAVGVHEKSIQRYARANPWFDRILTAAMARADRTELLASLEEWAAHEDGSVAEPPPLFEPVLPLGPPHRQYDLAPGPVNPEVLPASYVTAADELVGSGSDECFGLDDDLVADADRDLRVPGHALMLPDGTILPQFTTDNAKALLWRVANDRTHPACSTGLRRVADLALSTALRAQVLRETEALRRARREVGTIDVEATDVTGGSQSSRTVFIAIPRNGSEAPGRGPADG